jgi:putative RecB family exonuclease
MEGLMPAYSHSSLSAYQSCPRRYKFQYIEKPELEEEGEGIEGFMGKRVHEVLEKLYKDLVLSKVNSLEDLLLFYKQEWERNWHADVFITKKEFNKKHYYDTGRTAIVKYFDRYKPFNNTQTLGTEQLVTFKLGGHTIRGYIDRIARGVRGEYEIHDYKTSGRLPGQKAVDDDRQLGLYQIALEEMFGDVKSTKLVWHYLVFDQEMISYRSPAQIKDLKDETIQLIKTIERDDEFECRPSNLCDWCDFEQLCPARKHLFKVSNLPSNKYLSDSGVKLVSSFADVKTEIDSLKEQIEEKEGVLDQIREAAIAFSQKNGVENIYGKGHCLTIKEQKSIEFPGSKDEKRGDLEALVHKLKIWDEVSSLVTTKLAKLVGSGNMNAEARKKIMKYGQEVITMNVRFKKAKDREEEND